MERLLDSVDDLLSKQIWQDELLWVVIRKYLPNTGCTAEEVVSASKRSKFWVERAGHKDITIFLSNGDKGVTFRLNKDTERTDMAQVTSPGK